MFTILPITKMDRVSQHEFVQHRCNMYIALIYLLQIHQHYQSPSTCFRCWRSPSRSEHLELCAWYVNSPPRSCWQRMCLGKNTAHVFTDGASNWRTMHKVILLVVIFGIHFCEKFTYQVWDWFIFQDTSFVFFCGLRVGFQKTISQDVRTDKLRCSLQQARVQ